MGIHLQSTLNGGKWMRAREQVQSRTDNVEGETMGYKWLSYHQRRRVANVEWMDA